MQLFTGHDIIISRSIREAQKNETLGNLTSLLCKKKKKKKKKQVVFFRYILSVYHTVYSFALMHTKKRGSSAKLCRENGWYLFCAMFIIQHNSWYCICRCSDLC